MRAARMLPVPLILPAEIMLRAPSFTPPPTFPFNIMSPLVIVLISIPPESEPVIKAEPTVRLAPVLDSWIDPNPSPEPTVDTLLKVMAPPPD